MFLEAEVPGQKGTTQPILDFPQNVLLSSEIINPTPYKGTFETLRGRFWSLQCLRARPSENVRWSHMSRVINLQVSRSAEHPWPVSGLSTRVSIQEEPVSAYSHVQMRHLKMFSHSHHRL